MKNLAGDKNCDRQIRVELTAAGIRVVDIPIRSNSEVPYSLIGDYRGWVFERAWYYWQAYAFSAGYGLSEKTAEELNATFGAEVRVNGCAGGTDVKSHLSPKGTITSYHVDTPLGLRALVSAIKKDNQIRNT